MTTTTPEYALNIFEENKHGFYSISTHYVMRDRSSWKGIFGHNSVYYALDHITATCQGSNDKPEDSVYAWQITVHHLYNPDLRELKATTALIESVHKKMQKQKERIGAPTTFGQFCVRLAVALKVKKFVYYRESTASYMEFSLADGQQFIDNLVRMWQEKRRHQNAAWASL